MARLARREAREGDPFGRIEIPRIGVDQVVIQGTDPATLPPWQRPRGTGPFGASPRDQDPSPGMTSTIFPSCSPASSRSWAARISDSG